MVNEVLHNYAILPAGFNLSNFSGFNVKCNEKRLL